MEPCLTPLNHSNRSVLIEHDKTTPQLDSLEKKRKFLKELTSMEFNREIRIDSYT